MIALLHNAWKLPTHYVTNNQNVAIVTLVQMRCPYSAQNEQCHKIRKLMLKCLFTNTTKGYFKQNILFETKSIQLFAPRRKLSIMGTDRFYNIVT